MGKDDPTPRYAEPPPHWSKGKTHQVPHHTHPKGLPRLSISTGGDDYPLDIADHDILTGNDVVGCGRIRYYVDTDAALGSSSAARGLYTAMEVNSHEDLYQTDLCAIQGSLTLKGAPIYSRNGDVAVIAGLYGTVDVNTTIAPEIPMMCGVAARCTVTANTAGDADLSALYIAPASCAASTTDTSYGIYIDNQAGTGATTPYALLCKGGHVAFNTNGENDSDFTIESRNKNIFYVDASADTLAVGDTAGSNYATWASDGEYTMAGTARVYKTCTVRFNHSIITGTGKPTVVTLGAHSGFSLPVYNNDDEELFSCVSLPADLDTTENMTAYIGCYLDTANNTKKFKLQVSWTIDDLAAHDVLSATTTDVATETTTGNVNQYTSYKPSFAIASVAAGAAAGNKIGIRIRRLAASGDEIAGEVVVCGLALRYVSNKLGTAT